MRGSLADESAHSNGLLDGRRTHIFAILELVLLLEPTSNSDPTILAHPSKVTGVETVVVRKEKDGQSVVL